LVKRTAMAIAMCAVMVLVAAVPVMADTWDVVKGDKGPNNSAVTWVYTPTGYGIWTGHVVNTGLRSIVVDVDDNTDGMLVNILHQRIRFAAYDQYPNGVLDTSGAVMAAGRTYSITITPNGPKGTSCTVTDMFDEAIPPVAVMSATMTYMKVTVDGSDSYDLDGTIQSYSWSFGDGAVASGATAEHTYAAAGMYDVVLVVVDNDGLEGTASEMVTAVMPPIPIADFTPTVTGMTVDVDATASSAAAGIASYTWSWGDASAPEVVTSPLASHTYAQMGPMGLAESLSAGTTESVVINADIPPTPYNCWGYVTDAGGNLVFDAAVTITDTTTGTVWTTTTDLVYGYYSVDLNMYWESPTGVGWANGDTIKVDVVKEAATGSAQGIAGGLGNEAFIQLDVVVIGGGPTAHDFTITLTVTDMLGQTASVSKIVTLWW